MTDERARRAERPRDSASPARSERGDPGGQERAGESTSRSRTARAQKHEPATAGRRSKTLQTVTIVLLLLGLLTAIFVFQNTQGVEINFLVWSVDAPLAAALLLAVVIGGILAFLVAYVRQRQYRRAVRREHEVHSP
ncbi:hypothetical protein BH18ACT15_BH18ACT15_05590 [soil metagenome]